MADLSREFGVEGIFKGSKESVVEGAISNLENNRQALFRMLGGVYEPSGFKYQVFGTPKVTVEQQEGETKQETHLKREDTYKALERVVKEENIQFEGEMTVHIREDYTINYELVMAHGTGRDKKSLVKAIADEEKTLRERYGARMVIEPQEVEFKVSHYTGGWTLKGKKAKKPHGSEVGAGDSKKCIEEAEEKALTAVGDKKFKGSVYEGAHIFVVYGEPVRGLTSIEVKRGKLVKAGSPAAYTPTSATITDLF